MLVLAAATFSLRLGHPSLLIDEVYSWHTSRGDVSNLFFSLREREIDPPLYYLMLHGWLNVVGNDSEIALRLPSVLCGVGVVAAIYWLAALVAGRWAALAAAALAAVSPIMFVCAQQARGYTLLMLALTIAAAAAIQGARDRSGFMLAVATVAAPCAVALHYTSVCVLAPLAIWLWRQPAVRLRWRLGLGVAVGLPLAALAPLLLYQLGNGQHDGATHGALSAFDALRIMGTPFDGRTITGSVIAREIGALVVIEALALLALAECLHRVRARRLIVVCGLVPLVVVAVVAATAPPFALTRYTAGAAPFILVALGAVIAHAPRAAAIVLAVAALIASGIGLLSSQRRDGMHPDTRAAVAMAARHWEQDDQLIGLGYLGVRDALDYYATRLLPGQNDHVSAFATIEASIGSPEVAAAVDRGRRLWFLSDPPLSDETLSDQLEQVGYEAVAARQFHTSAQIQLVKAQPAR